MKASTEIRQRAIALLDRLPEAMYYSNTTPSPSTLQVLL